MTKLHCTTNLPQVSPHTQWLACADAQQCCTGVGHAGCIASKPGVTVKLLHHVKLYGAQVCFTLDCPMYQVHRHVLAPGVMLSMQLLLSLSLSSL